MDTEEPMVGGWTAYQDLTPDCRSVFDEARAGLIGVEYEPQRVSVQIVAGINYRYQATATLPGPSRQSWRAMVEIHAPLDGKPYITQISRI